MSSGKTSFNLEDLKKIKNQIKQAKKEYEEKIEKGEIQKQKPTLSNTIIGVIVIFIIIALIIILTIKNLDVILMPKNSVTFEVKNQNGEVIDGLEIYVSSTDNSFTIEYNKESSISITELGVSPGNYEVYFRNIPNNYTCPQILDEFTMEKDGKIKLEYECTKEN